MTQPPPDYRPPTTDHRPLTIACGSDDGFAMYLLVMLTSLIQTQPEGTTFELYLMDGGISPAKREKITAILSKKPGVTYKWLDIDQERLSGLMTNPAMFHLTAATLMRLLLPDLVPERDRLIYIDADVLVNGDIGPMYRADFAGKPIIGVQDFWMPTLAALAHEEPTLPPDSVCFNAGIIVMDLARFRATDTIERVYAMLRNHPTWSDQEGLNSVLAGDWTPMPFLYNLQSGWANIPGMPESAVKQALLSYNGDVLGSSKMIHFTGSWKPWSPSWRHWARSLYNQRVGESGWFTPAEFAQWKRDRFWRTIETRLLKRP